MTDWGYCTLIRQPILHKKLIILWQIEFFSQVDLALWAPI